MSSPVSCFTRARNAPPLAARRHASVAIARSLRTGRRSSRAAQALSAEIARSIAAGTELTGAMQPLAQPHDAAEAVEHPEPVARRRRNQHAAVVGSQVQRGKRRPGEPPRFTRERGAVGRLDIPRLHHCIVVRACPTGQAPSGGVALISSGHDLSVAKENVHARNGRHRSAPRLSRKQMRRLLDRYRVTDGKRFRLADFDPADTAGHLLTKQQADIMVAEDVPPPRRVAGEAVRAG